MVEERWGFHTGVIILAKDYRIQMVAIRQKRRKQGQKGRFKHI